MDRFSEIVARCANFMINALNKASRDVIGDGNDASTAFIKNLQALQWGRVVSAVGIFSILEARLQDGLNCSDGFGELRKILASADEPALAARFENFFLAVNVLKHGRGRSYESLLLSGEALPFVVKARDQSFFSEGDVSEPDTLVLVDDAFVLNCAELVTNLITAVRRLRPNSIFA